MTLYIVRSMNSIFAGDFPRVPIINTPEKERDEGNFMLAKNYIESMFLRVTIEKAASNAN